MKKKITFIFGAGAELDYNLSSGLDFSKAVLGYDENFNKSKLFESLGEYRKSLYSNSNDNKDKMIDSWVPAHSIYDIDKEKIIKNSIKKKLLSENSEEISNKTNFDNIVKQNYDSLIKDKSVLERKSLLNKYANYMDILDSKFHTLIEPKVLGPQKFWFVVDCYTRAYLHLVGQILEIQDLNEDNIKDTLENPKVTYNKICEKIKNTKSNCKTYYSTLKDVCENFDIKIVTANYTPLAEKILNIKSNNISYIHGNFKLFEAPRLLTVYDVKEEILPENEFVFPYLFLQSGVKPIVERKQVKEYMKMIDFLDEADVVISLGYNIGVDDNEINSILRDYICKDTKFIFFNYTNDINNAKTEILKRLRIFSEKNNFTVININNENSYDRFKSTLNSLILDE